MSATSAPRGSAQAPELSPAPEVSFVIPCLNEEPSIALVVGQARDALVQLGVPGEIVVVDNGSEDRSAELARAAGA
ncbi:MAG TPA: glycosyltransferase, partial [Gaiellaceae bacterium]